MANYYAQLEESGPYIFDSAVAVTMQGYMITFCLQDVL